MPVTRADTLDYALERLAGCAYLDVPGFAFHGVMGAETLSTLGHDDVVQSWITDYQKRHEPIPAPPPSERLDPEDEPALQYAMGDTARVSDWVAMFKEELWDRPWPEVLRRWLPRLLPGYAGALTHGLIRVAHGVRAMPPAGVPSSLVLDELARGLAFWAATFKVLPGRPALHGPFALPTAIARLPRPCEPWPMSEAGSFAHIGELAGFPGAVEALQPPESADAALSALSASFCRVLLAHPTVFAVPLVHTVTPIAAARILLPHLPEAVGASVYAQLWQVGAAITLSFTPSTMSADPGLETDPPTMDQVVAAAVEHRDPHALKFAEACAREHAIAPDPVYPLAAQHVLRQLPRW